MRSLSTGATCGRGEEKFQLQPQVKLPEMHFPLTQPPSRGSPHCFAPDLGPSLPLPLCPTCSTVSSSHITSYLTYLQVVTQAIFCQILIVPWLSTLL